MSALELLRLQNSAATDFPVLKIGLVTNFTDGVLAKLLRGAGAELRIDLSVKSQPYRLHQDFLRGLSDDFLDCQALVIWIDLNAYRAQELHSEESLSETIAAAGEVISKISRPCLFIISPAATGSTHAYLYQADPHQRAFETWRAAVEKWSEQNSNVYLVDTARLALRLGQTAVWDWRGLYAFDMPFTQDFLASVAREAAALLSPLSGRVKKCLVLDLDNTLWGGVIGEDGLNGIKLGTEYPGNAFVEFQKKLKDLSSRGILLAINSKNNWADVQPVFAEHPYMILKEADFAAIRTNWDDKAENMRSLATELNIGLDSFVFLDDDAVQRAWVKEQLPEVLVPEFGGAPETYVPALLHLSAFHVLRVTSEDGKKLQQYKEEANRKQLERRMTKEEYVDSLSITIEIKRNDPSVIARSAQLTQKTNQFNVTTRRYTEADIESFMKNGEVFAADIKDRFGAYGLTALVIIAKDGDEALIDTFLMSCRVLGRGVEYALWHALAKHLKESGFKKVRAVFVPTAKNAPASQFLATAGFTETKKEDSGAVFYELSLDDYLQKESQPLVYNSISVSFA